MTNSKNATADTMAAGITNKRKNELGIKKSLKENPISICCKIWTDRIFANNLTDKLTTLAKYETVSKKINGGNPITSIPFGAKILKKFHLWYIIPIIFIPQKYVKTINKLKIRDVVTE